MSKFTLVTLPSNIRPQKNLFNDNDPSALSSVSKDNAYSLLINNLPPGVTLQVEISLSTAVHTVQQTISREANLSISTQNREKFAFGSDFPANQVFQNYLGNILPLAVFGANATCANCNNDPQVILKANAFESSMLQVVLTPQNSLNSFWSGTLTITYIQIKGKNNLFVNNPISLWTEPNDPTEPLDDSGAYAGLIASCLQVTLVGSAQSACTPSAS